MNEPHWYAVHTGPRQEDAANQNLRRQGYWTFFPFERVRKRRKLPNRDQHRVEWIERPYFPRYLFVALRKPNESIYAVNETDGVSTVVYCGEEPLEVPQGVMDELMSRADVNGAVGSVDTVSRKRFRAGQEVRFVEGSPLAGFIAVVSIDRGRNVRVWLETLGKDREISVDPSLVVAS